MTVNIRIETVTPEMAINWLAENTYQHQRGLSVLHAKFLAEEMQRGTFKQDTVIQFCLSQSGSRVLTDGQHRLNALIQAGLDQRFVIIEKDQMTDDEIALDYTRTDKGRRRSVSDDYRALSLEDELDRTATQINQLGSAVALISTGFREVAQRRLHTDDRLRMMRDYNDAYGIFLDIAAGCSREVRGGINRAATVAVAVVTLRYSVITYQDKVSTFWRGAIWDDGLRLGDARKVANRHLLETGMAGGMTSTKRSRIVSAAFSSRYLANCFNAFIDDRLLSYTKVLSVSKPIMIPGSPFDGK